MLQCFKINAVVLTIGPLYFLNSNHSFAGFKIVFLLKKAIGIKQKLISNHFVLTTVQLAVFNPEKEWKLVSSFTNTTKGKFISGRGLLVNFWCKNWVYENSFSGLYILIILKKDFIHIVIYFCRGIQNNFLAVNFKKILVSQT